MLKEKMGFLQAYVFRPWKISISKFSLLKKPSQVHPNRNWQAASLSSTLFKKMKNGFASELIPVWKTSNQMNSEKLYVLI